MFKTLKPLDRALHRSLRFAPAQPYHFAAKERLVPITVGEAAMIAREYPIVFPLQDGAPPFAVLGVREGVNAYVRPSGHWVARYVPAQVRRYPFMLADSPGSQGNGSGEQQYVLTFVADAPHLGESEGEFLFTPAGEPTPTLQKVQAVLLHLQRDLHQTLTAMQQIGAAGLLVEQDLKVQSRAGVTFTLTGLRILDRERFAALSAEALHSLHRSGALMLLHAHVVSLPNLQDGPLVYGQAPAPTAAPDTIGFEGIDWSRLGLPEDPPAH